MFFATRSSVERYRLGQSNGELRAAWSDSEEERAIFCAMQLYVDQAERLAISRGADVTIYQMEAWEQSYYFGRTPQEVEYMMRILQVMAQGNDVPTPESYTIAEEICAALFAPRPGAPYVIPRDLWSHDEGRRQRRRDAVESAANPTPTLVPIARWLKRAFGELISQAEASRRLGLTEEGVRARIREGRLRSVRVGGNVMIPAADLPL